MSPCMNDTNKSNVFDYGCFCGDDSPYVKCLVMVMMSTHISRININSLAQSKDDKVWIS
jgi:hypothetical protein